MTVREEIAAAVNVLDGIEITAYYELVSAPGQGWVERTRTEFPNRLGGEDYWGVVVMVPADLNAAQRWIDENQPRIVAALKTSKALIVTTALPQLVAQQDNSSIRALVIEGHRETEE